MFCPRCGAENSTEQQYCRHCGLQLAGARLALEGRLTEALARIEKGERSVKRGAMMLTIFVLVAILIAVVLGRSPAIFQANGVTIYVDWEMTLVFALLFGIPGLVFGLRGIRSATRVLKETEQKVIASKSLDQIALPTNPQAELVTSGTQPPPSVTEQTTHKMNSPDSQNN